jgi:hypothetical protein
MTAPLDGHPALVEALVDRAKGQGGSNQSGS